MVPITIDLEGRGGAVVEIVVAAEEEEVEEEGEAVLVVVVVWRREVLRRCFLEGVVVGCLWLVEGVKQGRKNRRRVSMAMVVYLMVTERMELWECVS